VDAVIHRGRSIDVETVIVNGEVIMRDRQLTRVDKAALFDDCPSHFLQCPQIAMGTYFFAAGCSNSPACLDPRQVNDAQTSNRQLATHSI
jgi:hypothetical protein